MTDIDFPLDELPPPPEKPWTPKVHDWDEEGLDPLDRTTQMPIDLAAAMEDSGAAMAAATVAPLAAAWTRLRTGAGRAWRDRAERLAAEHPDAAMVERAREHTQGIKDVDRIAAYRVAHAEELKAIRLSIRLRLWGPVGFFMFMVLLDKYLLNVPWFTLATVGLGLGLAATGGAASWRAGGAANRGQPAATPEDLAAPEVAAPTMTLDAVTITNALKEQGWLKDGQPISVTKVKPMPNGNGWSCWVKLPPNLSARDVIKKRHEIANYLDTVDQCLVMLRGAKSNRDLYLWHADHPPLAAAPTTSPLTECKSRVNGWRGIPIGLTIHGEPIVARLAGTPGWLIVGDPGQGKSFLARVISLGVALDPDAQGIWMDPDSSGTWEPFAKVGEYLEGSTSEDLLAMVMRLEELAGPELRRRRAALAEYRRKSKMQVAESKVTERIARDKTSGLPLLVVTIEECHALLRSEYRDRAMAAMITLATQGRKWGIVLVLLTQYASNTNLPVEIRNVLATRICLRVATEGSAKIALGDDYATSGMDPIALTPEEKGAFFFRGEGKIAPAEPWVLGRGDLVDDNEVDPVLEFAVALRRERRPELLPRASRTGAEQPEPEGDTLVAELEPDDLAHLVHLVEIFEPGEDELSSVAIVDRLGMKHPGLYGKLTPTGMNRFIKPFDLITVKLKGTTFRDLRGLRLREVEHALIRLRETGQTDGPGTGQ